MSLERKLPLLMTTVVSAVLVGALSTTYGILKRSAEGSAQERMLRAAQTIAGSAERAIRERGSRLRELGRSPEFVAAVRRSDQQRMTALLQPLHAGSTDASLAMEIWNAAGERTFHIGAPVTDEERTSAIRTWLGDSAASLPRDSATVSPLYEWNGRVLFWVVAPIWARTSIVGYIAQQRRTGGPQEAIASLPGLVGEEVTLQIRNREGPFWSAAPGRPGARPSRRDSTETSVQDVLPSGERLIAAEAAIDGSPWIVVLHAPREGVLARPRATMLRLLLLGSVLASLGAILAWVVSRRITRPLTSVTSAAEAVARGDYDRRVTASGDDEVGRLATSFNKMANDIAASRRELERRTVEAEEARVEAERANRAKADFLAVMSHELRTPLNAISGYAELLKLGIYGQVSDAQQDALARIARNQEHLLALINDVLNYAKIDAGQVQYNIRDVPVDDVLSGIDPLVAPQLRAKGLEFASCVCDPRLTVRADRDKLQQVLLNLLTNAIKFTPVGGRITLDAETRPDSVRILVKDTGSGIPAKRLPHIFDAFVQGERALNRPHDGVGLGLAIARDLARGMGGELTVESEPGKGSTFSVTLQRGAAAPLPVRKTPITVSVT